MDYMVITGIYLPYIALMGIGFLIAEFILPTKGALGAVGAVCFVLSTIALTQSPQPKPHLSFLMCIILNVIVLGTAATILYFTHRGYTAHKKDDFNLAGQTALVVEWTEHYQRVELSGALWSAMTRDGQKLKNGQSVRIVGQEKLTLIVEPVGDFS